jgi:hypothetical protein
VKLQRLTVAVLVIMAFASGTALAQEPKPAPEPLPPPATVGVRPPRPAPAIPLEVQVVISRYQGEKRVSSLPYTLAVNSDGINSQLTVGANIPVPTTTFAPAGDSKPMVSWNYQNVGTNIDCRVTPTDDGRFDITVSVDESSVLTNTDGTRPQRIESMERRPGLRSRCEW